MAIPHNDQQSTTNPALHVAIIGAGIAGVTLALGLLSRNISVAVYERGSSLREIGAGIGFTANAERAMKLLDPEIHAAFKRVTVRNGTDYFNWMDGVREGGGSKLIHQMYLGERGFEGCHRADFLDELIKRVPEGVVSFGRNLDAIEDFAEGGRVKLVFADGSVGYADVGEFSTLVGDQWSGRIADQMALFWLTVIGCDGIRSRARQLLLGIDDPASHPTYTHKYAFRGLIPMAKARAALGSDATETRHMYLGPNSHALTFPVAGGNLLNVVAFTTDAADWPLPEKFTAPAAKSDAVEAFAGFNSTVRSIIGLLPEQLDKWAVFDTYDHPLSTWVKGRVCLAGDAAHAAAPYHGAGAGFAIEDGAVLAHLLASVSERSSRANVVAAALRAYELVRLPRAQWLVQSSRFVGEMYQWQDSDIKDDPQRCAAEIEWRSRTIWDYDAEQMLAQAEEEFLK